MGSTSNIRHEYAAVFRYTVLFFFASLLFEASCVSCGNHALQLVLVHLLNDPSLYPGDPFAATLPHYASMLWRVVALCARHVDLEHVLFGGFLLGRFLVIFAAG